MTATRQLVERYLQGWNETDPLRRRALIEDVYAEHAAYVDPMIEARGWEAIDATIAAVQGMFPGHVFTLAGASMRTTTSHVSIGTWPSPARTNRW